MIYGERKDDNFIQIKISDDGIGMTSDQLQKVFDDFYRANPQNSNNKSSGLGMSICKRIVERHGGTIHCESLGLGRGTDVIIKLPVKPKGADEEDVNEKMKYAISSLKEFRIPNE